MISKRTLIFLVKVTLQFGFSPNAQQCNDLGAARECQSACYDRLSDCRLGCGQNDEDCLTRCNIDLGDCFADCPCGMKCPAGCSDCDSQFCKCRENPEDDPSYKVCENKAGAEFYDCLVHCGLGDVVCELQCNRDLADKVEKCPCKSGCPDGCPCPDYECPSTSPNVTTTATTSTTAISTTTTAVIPGNCPVPSLSVICVEECLYDHQTCKKDCGASLECQHECDQQLIPCIESCPCYSQCPAGCDDCANPVCNVADSVLVLNTYINNVPLVVDGFGNSRQPNFVMEAETQVYNSCGVTFKDKMYVYGGDSQKTQVSRVVGCTLKRVGTLPFEHYFGACATGRGEIYLCFNRNNDNDAKKCRKSNDPERNFEAITNSNFVHQVTRMASSQDILFVLGDGRSSSTRHNKAETYNFESGRWTSVAAYPFSSYIYYAPIVHSRNSFYVIGGYTAANYSPIIARYSMETQSWTQAGNLNTGRRGHGAIELGNNFLVIGGQDGTLPTEKCTINADDEVECNTQEPDLTYYYYYPELFYVPYDFC